MEGGVSEWAPEESVSSPLEAPSAPPIAVFPLDRSFNRAMAEACEEHGETRTPSDQLTFVSQVRELSVDSLMEFARPFLQSQTSQASIYTLTESDNVSPLDEGDADFGPVVEDYFAGGGEGGGGGAREGLEQAIDLLKERILGMAPQTPAEHEERAQLVQKLIMLRLRIQEMDEPAPEGGGSDGTAVSCMGHELRKVPLLRLLRKKRERLSVHCEVCGQMMILPTSQLQCGRCGYYCHQRCVGGIARHCVADEVEKNPSLMMDICPEKGLDQQNFACAECRKPFSMDSSSVWETGIRVCDYNGAYYCPTCHRNDLAISPGRAVKNWDLSAHPVCRASQQLLTLLHHQPLIRILEMNKELLVHVEELAYMEQLRPRLAVLQRMMLDCQQAPQIALLRLLPAQRKHLLQASGLYSLNDLLEMQHGRLARQLDGFYQELEGHVRACPTCQLLKQPCVYCWDSGDKLYAFQEQARVCGTCGALAHRTCARNSSQAAARHCPNCKPLP